MGVNLCLYNNLLYKKGYSLLLRLLLLRLLAFVLTLEVEIERSFARS